MKRPSRIRVAPVIPGKDVLRDMDQILHRLGQVTNAWATMENVLCVIFGYLAGTDQETSTIIFYTPSSFRGRLEMVRNLAKHKMPNCVEKSLFWNALEKLNGLNGVRNSFVHASFGMLHGQKVDGTPYGWVTRNNVNPGKGEIRTSVKGQIGELDTHLELMESLFQFFYFFSQWDNPSPCPIRAWAKIAFIKPGIMVS